MSKRYFRIVVTVDIAEEEFEWWCSDNETTSNLKPSDVIEMIRDDGLDRVLDIAGDVEDYVKVTDYNE